MSREKTSKIARNILIKKKGTICINCQQNKNNEIIFHHVIPLSLGGKDILSNIAPLCSNCHSLIHFGTKKNINHSQLIKKGLQKSTKQNGRPPITKDTIPQKFKEYYPLIKNKQKNITEAAKELHYSRTTIYKYIKIIENEH